MTLSPGVHFENLFDGDLVGSSHCENGLADFRFRQRFICIEERLDKYRRDDEHEKRENDSDSGSPDPPRFRCSAKNSVQHDQEDRAADDRDAKTDQLLSKPAWEILSGESVLMLANELLVNVKRKAQDINEQQINHAVTGDLQRPGPR